MGKTANCIKMLQALAGGKKYKNSELANTLGFKERNISEYRKELQECGYEFESTSGRYGGICLKKSVLLPSLCFTKEERDSLAFASSYVSNEGTIYCRDDFEKAMNKIFSAIRWDGKETPKVKITDRSRFALSTKELKERYDFFVKCIEKRLVAHIVYVVTIHKAIENDVEPYKLIMDDGSLFLLCYSRIQKKYQCIKLNNIQEYKTSGIGFSKDYFFNEDYVDNTDFNFLKEKVYHVELHLSSLCPYIGKRELGANQSERVLDDGSVILKFDTEDLEGTLRAILDFQGECEVLSPQILRDKLMTIGRKILKSNRKFKPEMANKELKPEQTNKNAEGLTNSNQTQQKSTDIIYQELIQDCENDEFISISTIQRKYSIGFPVAGRLFNRLCEEGYINPERCSKKPEGAFNELKAKKKESPKTDTFVPNGEVKSGNAPVSNSNDVTYLTVLLYCENMPTVGISDIQRHCSIGFPKAGEYMNKLIEDGCVFTDREKNEFKHKVNLEKVKNAINALKYKESNL